MMDVMLTMQESANLMECSKHDVLALFNQSKIEGKHDKRGRMWIEFASLTQYARNVVCRNPKEVGGG